MTIREGQSRVEQERQQEYQGKKPQSDASSEEIIEQIQASKKPASEKKPAAGEAKATPAPSAAKIVDSITTTSPSTAFSYQILGRQREPGEKRTRYVPRKASSDAVPDTREDIREKPDELVASSERVDTGNTAKASVPVDMPDAESGSGYEEAFDFLDDSATASLSAPWTTSRQFTHEPAVSVDSARELDERPENRPVAPNARNAISEKVAAEEAAGVVYENKADRRDQARRMLYEEGRDIIRDAGGIAVPTPVNIGRKSNMRFRQAAKNLKEMISLRLKDKTYRGTSFWDYMTSDPLLMPHEVSLGTSNLMESLMEPNSPILGIINDKLIELGRESEVLTVEECIADISLLVDVVNGRKKAGSKTWEVEPIDLEVVLDKSPVNVRESVQTRTLRLHYGRGIGLHPTQAKAFNADFDGDPGSVNFDQAQVKRYGRAMDWLIGTDGSPTLEMDYFPIDEMPLVGEGRTKKERRKDLQGKVFDLMIYNEFSWARDYIDEPSVEAGLKTIGRLYMEVCNSSNPIELKRKWKELVLAISKAGTTVSKVSGEFPNVEASRVLKSLYEFATRRRQLSIETQHADLFDESTGKWGGYEQREPIESEYPLVEDIVIMVDEIAAGRMPMNLEEYTLFCHKQFGEIEDQNIPFRLISDLGKAINRTDLVTIGSSFFGFEVEPGRNWTIEEMWRLTMVAGMAKAISGRSKISSYELAVSTAVRQMVLIDCPLPKYNPRDIEGSVRVFNEWIVQFIESYNRAMGMLAISQISWRGGMTLVRDTAATRFSSINDERDLAYAIEKVFGEYTIEALLPFWSYPSENVLEVSSEKRGYHKQNETMDPSIDHAYGLLRAKYVKMPINKFVINNRIWGKVERINGKPVDKNTAVSGRYKETMRSMGMSPNARGMLQPLDLIYLLADRQSKQLGNYEQRWASATSKIYNEIISNDKINESIANGDIDEAVSAYLEIVFTMSPDMFQYYGMDSPELFLSGEWGKKLFNAKSVDEFRSVLWNMMIKYRLAPASKIVSEIEKINENDSLTEEEKASRIEAVEARYMFELDALRSSSPAWDVIILEIIQGDVTWTELHTKGANLLRSVARQEWVVSDRAKDFWEKGTEEAPSETLMKYPTLLSYLTSEDVGYQEKANVLADVIRYHDEWAKPQSSHMIGMLAHHPDRIRSGKRFDEMDKGLKTDIDAIKESMDLLDSYHKTQKNIEEDAARIINEARADKVKFEERLKRLAHDPGYQVHVDTILAADAISAVYDKTYDDTEKARQQARVSGYFGCLMYMLNGGFFSHLHMTDNSVLNTVGANQITPMDIVKVLGDPTIEIYTYDQYGRKMRKPLTRESLCGGNSMDDVIAYLEENPRIACMCQRFTCGISPDTNGTARLNAIGPNLDPDGVVERVFPIVADRNRFLAVAALVTPAHGRAGGALSGAIDENIVALCQFMAKIAYQVEVDGSMDLNRVHDEIIDKLGITDEWLESFDYESLPSDCVLFSDIDEFNAKKMKLREEVVGELLDCIGIVSESMKQDIENGYGDPYVDIPDPEVSVFAIDGESFVAYYDVKQHLGGARTEVMVGVEGVETDNNLILTRYLESKDPKWVTDHGVTRRLEEGESYRDLSTRRSGWAQLHPVSKFLQIKREWGAEKFNLKAKKFGDDLINSIVKFVRMITNRAAGKLGLSKKHNPKMKNGLWTLDDGADLMRKLTLMQPEPDENGEITSESISAMRDKAIEMLADALIAADIRLGYISMDDNGYINDDIFIEADYYERADLMIAQNTDGTIVVRTLEQIATALNSRVSDAAIESENKDTIIAELDYIVETLGTDRDPFLKAYSDEDIAHDVVYSAKTYNSVGSSRTRASRALNPRASSVERNLEQISELYKGLDRAKQEEAERLGASGTSQLARKSTPPSREKAFKRTTGLAEEIKKRNKDLWGELAGIARPPKIQLPSGEWIYDKWASDTYRFDLVGVDFDIIAVKKKNGEIVRDEENNPIIVEYPGLRLFDIVPGPQSMVVFTECPTIDDQKLEWCRDYGMTAAFYGEEAVPPQYARDAVQISDNIWILPFFSMRMNGCESDVRFDGVLKPKGPAPSNIPVHRDNFVAAVENTTGEFRLGDSVAIMTKELANRVNIFFHSVKPSKFGIERLFPTIISWMPNKSYNMVFCEKQEIQQLLDGQLDPVTLKVFGYEDATLDLGVLRGDPGFTREKQRFDLRLIEYRKRFAETDENGMLMSDNKPDSIIGFVKLVDSTGDTKGFAPIWAFHLEESGRVPQKFDITRMEYSPETNSFYMSWKYTGGLAGHLIKFFEGIGASNKMMVSSRHAQSRRLQNGLPIDIFYPTATVSSRFFTTNKRIQTLSSLIMMTRADPKYGYNFAEDDGAFPDGETVVINGQPMLLKEAVLSYSIPRAAWRVACKWDAKTQTCNIRFHTDPQIDALVRFWVSECIRYGTVNPLTLLATRDGDGNEHIMYTEWEAFMTTSYEFQNALMAFMNRMHPDLCPPSIMPQAGYEDSNDWSKGHLFRPVYKNEGEEDYGVLQVLVPSYNDSGELVTYVPQNLYLSFAFFGEEFSGFKKVNFNAYNRSKDTLNLATNVSGFELAQMVAYGRSSVSRNSGHPIPASIEADPDDFMIDPGDNAEDMMRPPSTAVVPETPEKTKMRSDINAIISQLQSDDENVVWAAIDMVEDFSKEIKKASSEVALDPDIVDAIMLMKKLSTSMKRKRNKTLIGFAEKGLEIADGFITNDRNQVSVPREKLDYTIQFLYVMIDNFGLYKLKGKHADNVLADMKRTVAYLEGLR